MRTPEEIQADIERLEQECQNRKAALLNELSQSKLGISVGSTLTNGTQSLLVESIGSRYIKGKLTYNGYELRVDEAQAWKVAPSR